MAGPSSTEYGWKTVLGALIFLLVTHWFSRRRRIPKGLRLPPGPPGKFIVGNVSDMPTHHEWETFTQWAKIYGDMVHVKVLNTNIVIVNSADVAHDLFEKRSSKYSDRPDFPMLNDLMGLDWDFGLMHYGERWRRHRKYFDEMFRAAASVAHYDIQTRQTRIFLKRLSESPNNFIKHIRHLSGAIIMEITYGIQVLPEDDPYIQTAEAAAVATVQAGVSGAFLVDTFPILKYVPAWMPGAGFQRKALEWRIPITDMVVRPFEFVKRSMASEVVAPSMLTSLLEKLSARSDAPPDEEEIIRNSVGLAYFTGADTTVSALTTFILSMVLNPDIQHKAQAEVDSVIGLERLPRFKDRERLPYVNAVCKEVFRWRPVAPLGVPHCATEGDIYGNLFIPKRSVIIGNSWAMLRDERIFGPEPEKFNPERFLEPGRKDPVFAFGFGRRICPGRHMADNSIFIAVASILKVFDIIHARDIHGNEIPVKNTYTSGFVSYPEPFQCDFKPRVGLSEGLLFESYS